MLIHVNQHMNKADNYLQNFKFELQFLNDGVFVLFPTQHLSTSLTSEENSTTLTWQSSISLQSFASQILSLSSTHEKQVFCHVRPSSQPFSEFPRSPTAADLMDPRDPRGILRSRLSSKGEGSYGHYERHKRTWGMGFFV